MATLNEHTSVLAAISSDISDHSDTDFIYILSANKCQQQVRKNNRNNTLKQTKHWTNVYRKISWVMWLKLLGSKSFNYPKNESALAGTNCLVKDRSWKSASIQECSLTVLAPSGISWHLKSLFCWSLICPLEVSPHCHPGPRYTIDQQGIRHNWTQRKHLRNENW